MGLPRFAHSGETNAPQLTNAAGSLDALLNAMLVTGWSVQTATSVSVSSGVATVTLAGHGYSDRRLVTVAGATPGALNGNKLIRVTGAGTFTYPAPGVPDGVATGTITVRRAGCGWARPHNSANVSIYARTDPAATVMGLYLNDSNTGGAAPTYARARMVWDYTDIATWLNQAPLETQQSGGLYWPKGENNATPRAWVFIGDEKRFFLFTAGIGYPPASYAGALNGPMFFGDTVSYHPGDAHHAAICGANSTGSSLDQVGIGIGQFTSLTNGLGTNVWLARGSSQIGRPIAAGALGFGSGYMGGQGPTFPSTVGNGLLFSRPVHVRENLPSTGYPIRGEWPGLANPVSNIPGGELHLQLLENVQGSSAVWVLVAFQVTGSYGHMAFCLTEAWD